MYEYVLWSRESAHQLVHRRRRCVCVLRVPLEGFVVLAFHRDDAPLALASQEGLELRYRLEKLALATGRSA